MRLRERVTSGSSALEVIQARFWALLSACLSEWHLHGTYSSQLSWVFPKSDGIKEARGRQLGWGLGKLCAARRCGSEREQWTEGWKANFIGSKSESDPLVSAWPLLSFTDSCCVVIVSLNILWNAPLFRFFLSKPAFERFPNTFWPQHRLAHVSLAGVTIVF